MRLSTTRVLAPHDGRWWVADVLDQVRSRDDGHWRVVVRFTTEPGSTYVLAMPAAKCQALVADRDGTSPDSDSLSPERVM